MGNYRQDREERKKKFNKQCTYFRFVYMGSKIIHNGCDIGRGGFYGTLINERLEMKKRQDSEAERCWSHTFPAHDFEARTKEQLWKDIKEYVSKYRPGVDVQLTCNGIIYAIKATKKS